MKNAETDDIIVLAGKGHEDYQILAGGKKIHFDEREVVAEALEELKLTMAIYQMAERNYAEVHIGSEIIKTGDTAAILLGEGTRKIFFKDHT